MAWRKMSTSALEGKTFQFSYSIIAIVPMPPLCARAAGRAGVIKALDNGSWQLQQATRRGEVLVAGVLRRGCAMSATGRVRRWTSARTISRVTDARRLHQPTISRQASVMDSPSQTYEAVVVGSGPAGITVVGNLLEQKLSPILWVDKSFSGGRINYAYREVPSNTKVGLFVDFATALAPFRRIVSSTPSRSRWDEPNESDGVAVSGKADKLQDLRSLEQGKGCDLSHAADMCLILTEGLRRTPGVVAQPGQVEGAVLDESTQQWSVTLRDSAKSSGQSSTISAKRMVLCTGSSPNNSPLPVDIPGLYTLDLDCALSPTLLATVLSPIDSLTVAVIGASHSAILVLRNLYNLASTSKPNLRVKWFTRHPLRYAEFMDGWILRDNTGLKGEAATWAKQNLEPETMPDSDVAKYVKMIQYPSGTEKDVFEREMQGVEYYVQAIGYSRDPIPSLKTSSGRSIEPKYDHSSGGFTYDSKSETKVPGLFGAGIAFPEKVTDPHGNVEYAVGFFKFMRYIKKVVPEWI
ncbi:hypothetical protein LTR95_004740 [Oleoguttula sp. CCFEE 5521]